MVAGQGRGDRLRAAEPEGPRHAGPGAGRPGLAHGRRRRHRPQDRRRPLLRRRQAFRRASTSSRRPRSPPTSGTSTCSARPSAPKVADVPLAASKLDASVEQFTIDLKGEKDKGELKLHLGHDRARGELHRQVASRSSPGGGRPRARGARAPPARSPAAGRSPWAASRGRSWSRSTAPRSRPAPASRASRRPDACGSATSRPGCASMPRSRQSRASATASSWVLVISPMSSTSPRCANAASQARASAACEPAGAGTSDTTRQGARPRGDQLDGLEQPAHRVGRRDRRPPASATRTRRRRPRSRPRRAAPGPPRASPSAG